MALSSSERQVMLLHLQVAMFPINAPIWSARKFFEAIKKIYEAGDAVLNISDQPEVEVDASPADRNVLSIADLRWGDDGTLTLLLHHGDATATDPALMNLKNRQIRTAGKSDEDGLAHAAHLVISLPADNSKGASVKAALERVPGLGRSTVLSFLNRLILEASRFNSWNYRDPDTNKQIQYRPLIRASQPMSASLKADLSNGRLSRIEFVRYDVERGFDESDHVKPRSLTFVHVVDKHLLKSWNFGLFKKARVWARDNGYDEVQIRFKPAGGKGLLSPRFATEKADAEDTVYARLESVDGFDDALSQCPENIVDAVLNKMHAMFGRANLWV